MTAEPVVDSHPAIDTALVRRLVETQFPQWAGLPLKRLERTGSDHVIHRLGEELSVRLPRHRGAAGQARKESTWLPRLAPALPPAVPVPVGVGEPAFGYPWPWAVSRRLDGRGGDGGVPGGLGGRRRRAGGVPGRAPADPARRGRCRTVFREALGVDDATWTRGRGWALATGLNAYTSYGDDPRVAAQTARQINEALVRQHTA